MNAQERVPRFPPCVHRLEKTRTRPRPLLSHDKPSPGGQGDDAAQVVALPINLSCFGMDNRLPYGHNTAVSHSAETFL